VEHLVEDSPEDNAVKIAFINGVNTAFGGSGANANRTWLASLERIADAFTVIDTVPRFGLRTKGRLLKLLLALYFLPGTLFRASRVPVAEFFYKLSPILALKLWWRLSQARPDVVIWSHHSMFIYSLLTPFSRRVFLVQDLLYIRARSFGYSRRVCKWVFGLECAFYGRASSLMVLSESEYKILGRFVSRSTALISCLDSRVFAGATSEPEVKGVALISDWRRSENLHGVVQFLNGSGAVAVSPYAPPHIAVYGLGIDNLQMELERSGLAERCVFEYRGVYGHLGEVRESTFLVPIYQGAGIKLKVLEAFANGRYVLGTKAAFAGLRPTRLCGICALVEQPSDISASEPQGQRVREAFAKYYLRRFEDIGQVVLRLPVSRSASAV
jgi:hypothetical protein